MKGLRPPGRAGRIGGLLFILLSAVPLATTGASAQTLTTLYSFAGGIDGAYPLGGLIMDSAGNLYGTTANGGVTTDGTVFKLTPSGTETVLYTFTGGSDGENPQASLIIDSAANLYGMTPFGGSTACYLGCGAVFKLDSTGALTVLHDFAGYASDGGNPQAGLIMDSSGNLYGTTTEPYCCGGSGNMFKLDKSGTLTVLHNFTGGSDGGNPWSGLIMDSAGNLYGTTAFGGSFGGGTLFRLDTSGTLTALYSFGGDSIGAALPFAGVIMDSSGNFYGTTYGGGSCSYGTVFKVDTSGTLTELYSFTGGLASYAGLIADASGNLYGTTYTGGASGYGTVFKLSGTGFVPLLPFSAFSAKLDISSAGFDLNGNFTPGQGGTIQPLTQPLSLQVGTYSLTVPAGSFKAGPKGTFTYQGTISGVTLQIRISPNGANAYQIQVDASGVNLTGLINPVTVSLTIANNNGTTSVTADF